MRKFFVLILFYAVSTLSLEAQTRRVAKPTTAVNTAIKQVNTGDLSWYNLSQAERDELLHVIKRQEYVKELLAEGKRAKSFKMSAESVSLSFLTNYKLAQKLGFGRSIKRGQMLDSYIKKIRETATEINTANEMQTVQLQSASQQRSQVVALTSNLLKQIDQSQKDIINNLE